MHSIQSHVCLVWALFLRSKSTPKIVLDGWGPLLCSRIRDEKKKHTQCGHYSDDTMAGGISNRTHTPLQHTMYIPKHTDQISQNARILWLQWNFFVSLGTNSRLMVVGTAFGRRIQLSSWSVDNIVPIQALFTATERFPNATNANFNFSPSIKCVFSPIHIFVLFWPDSVHFCVHFPTSGYISQNGEWMNGVYPV